MLPVVAIVGRPNVGKSTLFNRLTQTRDALVTALPGTTRDRQFGEVNQNNRHFIIIDTGGMSAEPGEMDQLITQQAKEAIHDADKIMFVVDGRDGITAEDHLIKDELRRLGKPLFLVVNKTEGKDTHLVTAEMHELGLGEPLPISAAHGGGIDELITALFPQPLEEAKHDEATPETRIKLAIIGRPNVGKSTLTNRLLGEDRVIVHDSPGTTRDSIFIPLERLDKQYTLIDTAGVRKRGKVHDLPEKFSIVKTLQAIEQAHVILYVIDARIGVSDQDLKLLGFVLECGKALVIAVNKWDNMTDDERQHARASLDRRLDFVRFARIHFISALHGSGVGNLFDSVNEAYTSAVQTLSTPLLSRLLQEAQATHQPPLVHGRRVKLRYAHPGGYNPPCIVIHGNQLHALPESYRKFLEHFYQKKLNLFGTPIRIFYKTSDNPYTQK